MNVMIILNIVLILFVFSCFVSFSGSTPKWLSVILGEKEDTFALPFTILFLVAIALSILFVYQAGKYPVLITEDVQTAKPITWNNIRYDIVDDSCTVIYTDDMGHSYLITKNTKNESEQVIQNCHFWFDCFYAKGKKYELRLSENDYKKLMDWIITREDGTKPSLNEQKKTYELCSADTRAVYQQLKDHTISIPLFTVAIIYLIIMAITILAIFFFTACL